MRTHIYRNCTTDRVLRVSATAPTVQKLKKQIERCNQALRDIERLQESLRILRNGRQNGHNGSIKTALGDPRGRVKEARRRIITMPNSGHSPTSRFRSISR